MSYSIEPAYTVNNELIRQLIKAGTDPVNQWFFTDGAFSPSTMIENASDTWLHENFVVISEKELIAFFTASWERPLDVIDSFRMIFFDKHKSLTALRAFFQYLDYLFVVRGCQVFRWSVAVKNTHAMRQYERFIRECGGHKIGKKTRGQKSYTGEISDSILYELTRKSYFDWKRREARTC